MNVVKTQFNEGHPDDAGLIILLCNSVNLSPQGSFSAKDGNDRGHLVGQFLRDDSSNHALR